MTLVAFQYFLERRFELFERNTLEHLASNGLMFAKSTPDENVVALDSLAGDLHLRTEQSNVAHVMLRAGIGTAGQVNIDRLVESNSFVEIVRQFERVAFGIARGEL